MVPLDADLKAMLDLSASVANVTWADPIDGEIDEQPTKVIRPVAMRIQPIGGRLRRLPEGKQVDANEYGFADSDAAFVEGEYVGIRSGSGNAYYVGQVWEVVHVNPVHQSHQEVMLARRPNIQPGASPLVDP